MAKQARSTSDPKKRQSTQYDPLLTDLFASSLGPIRSTQKPLLESKAVITTKSGSGKLQHAEINGPPIKETAEETSNPRDAEQPSQEEEATPQWSFELKKSDERSRKRKRKDTDDNLEGAYLQNLAREELKADAKRQKQKHIDRPRLAEPEDQDDDDAEERSDADNTESTEGAEGQSPSQRVPQHESLRPSKAESDLEKASRTVFLANVSTVAIKSKSGKRSLLEHLASFLPSLPKQDINHSVESLRFRSTAFTDSAVPKKAAFAKRDLMDSTTKSTNAYAVYTTQLAAREATKRLNGSIVLDRHLRVDSVAHPAKQDHRRCVFVGNLGFVDDPNSMNATEDDANNKRPRKAKEAADIEEGLWRQFGKAGKVESVRVVRDKTTRVGKGFAYVQFEDPNSVEKALLFNDKKFPPLLPRTLRVTRAKNASKTNSRLNPEQRPDRKSLRSQKLSGYQPKISSQVQSLEGRAGKLLGRAGAAQYRGNGEKQAKFPQIDKVSKPLVFEGYRAKSREGKGSPNLGGTNKKQGKPSTRSSRRGAAFKASGKKKPKS